MKARGVALDNFSLLKAKVGETLDIVCTAMAADTTDLIIHWHKDGSVVSL